MTVLLAKLGHPEQRLPPVIHVAGTNGKGSTTAFMRAMLEAAGKTRACLHLAASRPLPRAHPPRRAGGGRFVDEDALVDALISRSSGSMPARRSPSSRSPPRRRSELFADHPADFTLLEVGLGGRFDATNVVAAPLATVDHVDLDRPREVPRRHARPRSPARRPASSSAAGRWSSRRRATAGST